MNGACHCALSVAMNECRQSYMNHAYTHTTMSVRVETKRDPTATGRIAVLSHSYTGGLLSLSYFHVYSVHIPSRSLVTHLSLSFAFPSGQVCAVCVGWAPLPSRHFIHIFISIFLVQMCCLSHPPPPPLRQSHHCFSLWVSPNPFL